MIDITVLPVFIGWDAREPEAAEVCSSSLRKNAQIPVHVQYLKERPLKHAGLYKRKWRHDGSQRFDLVDGKPFSTEFSFTRFLVPALCQWEGWAVFVDCDFFFNVDIGRLVQELDPRYAVMLCKQAYKPLHDVKMDGVQQQKYWRKNWSSFMAFNCGHPSNKLLTVQAVNEEPGYWLHGFGWLTEAEIGGLDPRWNWLYGTTEGTPLAVHFTEGGPWFPHLRDSELPYFDAWRDEAKRIGVWNDAAA